MLDARCDVFVNNIANQHQCELGGCSKYPDCIEHDTALIQFDASEWALVAKISVWEAKSVF